MGRYVVRLCRFRFHAIVCGLVGTMVQLQNHIFVRLGAANHGCVLTRERKQED
jgi:hypothetical protein